MIIPIKPMMEEAFENMDFMEAARLRDEMFRMQGQLKEMKSKEESSLKVCLLREVFFKSDLNLFVCWKRGFGAKNYP